MDAWAKVVGLPLGLVAFSLYLLYKFATSRKQSNFVRISFLTMAILVMLSGLGLGYLQFRKLQSTRSNEAQAPGLSQQQTNQVHQNTTGSGSPAIQGVQGDVSVTVGESSSNKNNKEIEKTKTHPKQAE